MLKTLTFFCLCFLTATTLRAQNSLTVVNPNSTFNRTQGIISEPVIEVTPNGAYARVDMIFRINADPSYSSSLQLESIFEFSLPNGSYIHDSWLWLDETNIIRAEMVEKNRAITIYEGIVNRRRDPSLLIKTGESSYKLNVYPLMTTYPRKVKISYSVPFRWRNNQMIVELPLDIMKASYVLPDIPVKINHNSSYTNPAIVEDDYNKYLLSSSSTQDVLMIHGSKYNSATTFNISYTPANANNIILNTFAMSPTEGLYQLTIPPAALGTGSIRNTTFIFDYSSNSSIYTVNEIVQSLRSSMLTDYNTTDSFNLVFLQNGAAVKAFNTWQPLTKQMVDSAIKMLPLTVPTTNKLGDLLKDGLTFCAGKTDAQAVLISNNTSYTTSQSTADALFDEIKTHIGSFKNKIHIFNYSSYKTSVLGGMYNANDILYNKLTLTAGGSLYKFLSSTYYYLQGKYKYTYNINAANVLTEIAANSGVSTSSYNINIGVNNGFTYSPFIVNGNKLTLASHFTEIGRYNGDIPNGTNVQVQAITPGGIINKQFTVNSIGSGNDSYLQTWVHKYIEDLVRQGNQSYVQEIIDSSIEHRVLCDYTAFLAVETGDTIHTNINDNPNLTINDIKDRKLAVKCYPNPFTDHITIEFPAGVQSIEIFDITGRKIFSKQIATGEKSLVWNGKDNDGNTLPQGLYMIVAATETERYTTKVMKQ